MRKPDGSRPTYVSLFLFDFWLVTFSKVVSTPLKHTPSPRGGFKHFFFSSLPGKMIQFDKYIFQLGTSNSLTFTKGNRRSPGLCHIQVIHCYTDEDQIPMNLEESDAQQKACRWMPWMSCVFFFERKQKLIISCLHVWNSWCMRCTYSDSIFPAFEGLFFLNLPFLGFRGMSRFLIVCILPSKWTPSWWCSQPLGFLQTLR